MIEDKSGLYFLSILSVALKGEEVPTKKELEQKLAVLEATIRYLGREPEDALYIHSSSAKIIESLESDSSSFIFCERFKHELVLFQLENL